MAATVVLNQRGMFKNTNTQGKYIYILLYRERGGRLISKSALEFKIVSCDCLGILFGTY